MRHRLFLKEIEICPLKRLVVFLTVDLRSDGSDLFDDVARSNCPRNLTWTAQIELIYPVTVPQPLVSSCVLFFSYDFS